MPKQQPYQYTYHSINQPQNTNIQNNQFSGISSFTQQSNINCANKFVVNSNGNNTNGGYQYHYSYSNQGNDNKISNNFNNICNNNKGFPYGVNLYDNPNSHNYINHD